MTAVIIIACIVFVAYLIISLILRNKKINNTTKECFAKKVYKISLWCANGSIAITVIGLVLVLIFQEIDFVGWFFEHVVSCIFLAGFLMIPIGQVAAKYIPDDKPKEREN